MTSPSKSVNPTLRIARAPGYTGPLPAYQSKGASGLDLCAPVGIFLQAGETQRIKAGIMLDIPEGYEGQLRPRSSLSALGITVHLGTIDQDYNGEIEIVVTSSHERTAYFEKGQRIAQLVIAPVARCEVVEVTAAELTPTARGTGGFGSTGVL